MKIVNLEGQIIKKDSSSAIQKFLYNNIEKNFLKRFLLKILITKPISWLINLYWNTPWSCQYAYQIIKKYQIILSNFEKKQFKSYNEFFTRKYKEIEIPAGNSSFISPCEGKLSIYRITKHSFYCIKGTNYNLYDLLQDPMLSQEYQGGYLLVFRLDPHDYHRYLFIDEGKLLSFPRKIKGKLHTVNPIAFQNFNVFKENTREYSILQTKNFDKIIQMEVGALLVGKIKNHHCHIFSKGQEKGFFECGGSTIIVLVKKNIVDFDYRILKNTQKQCETKIKIADVVGHKITPSLF